MFPIYWGEDRKRIYGVVSHFFCAKSMSSLHIADVSLWNWQSELDSKRQTPTTDADQSRVEEDGKNKEQRRKDSETMALRMRKCLAPITEGEEVLARWSVDGWYYQGTVSYDASSLYITRL